MSKPLPPLCDVWVDFEVAGSLPEYCDLIGFRYLLVWLCLGLRGERGVTWRICVCVLVLRHNSSAVFLACDSTICMQRVHAEACGVRMRDGVCPILR